MRAEKCQPCCRSPINCADIDAVSCVSITVVNILGRGNVVYIEQEAAVKSHEIFTSIRNPQSLPAIYHFFQTLSCTPNLRLCNTRNTCSDFRCTSWIKCEIRDRFAFSLAEIDPATSQAVFCWSQLELTLYTSFAQTNQVLFAFRHVCSSFSSRNKTRTAWVLT